MKPSIKNIIVLEHFQKSLFNFRTNVRINKLNQNFTIDIFIIISHLKNRQILKIYYTKGNNSAFFHKFKIGHLRIVVLKFEDEG